MKFLPTVSYSRFIEIVCMLTIQTKRMNAMYFVKIHIIIHVTNTATKYVIKVIRCVIYNYKPYMLYIHVYIYDTILYNSY